MNSIWSPYPHDIKKSWSRNTITRSKVNIAECVAKNSLIVSDKTDESPRFMHRHTSYLSLDAYLIRERTYSHYVKIVAIVHTSLRVSLSLSLPRSYRTFNRVSVARFSPFFNATSRAHPCILYAFLWPLPHKSHTLAPTCARVRYARSSSSATSTTWLSFGT